MTDLDDLPFHDPDWPPAPVVEREPRKCRHPRYARIRTAEGTRCEPCGHVFDDALIRRGRSSRRLGGDTERRIEKVYGPVKIGERGDPVDHIGRVWKWQSKATRALPPKWLAVIDRPVQRSPISMEIAGPYGRMQHLYGTRSPVVIRSFVSRGIRTRDWLFVGEEDARDHLGLPFETFGWWVIPGDWWLDHFGRDGERSEA